MWAESGEQMNTSDAVIELLAIRQEGKQQHISTKKTQVAFLSQFEFKEQAEILLGVAMADPDGARAIVQSFRDVIAEHKAAGKSDVLGGR